MFLNAFSRILHSISSFLGGLATNLLVFSTDFILFLLNLVSFKRKVGKVTLQGDAGFGGKWPEYRPPREGDSRSCCPALNALANHGIIPRDGRNIQYRDLSTAIRKTYNFSPTFCYFVPKYMAELLTRDHKRDTINLHDFSVHNGIEHDASLTRHDIYFQPDQSKPALDLIEDLLASATGPNNTLTPRDLSVVMRPYAYNTDTGRPYTGYGRMRMASRKTKIRPYIIRPYAYNELEKVTVYAVSGVYGKTLHVIEYADSAAQNSNQGVGAPIENEIIGYSIWCSPSSLVTFTHELAAGTFITVYCIKLLNLHGTVEYFL